MFVLLMSLDVKYRTVCINSHIVNQLKKSNHTHLLFILVTELNLVKSYKFLEMFFCLPDKTFGTVGMFMKTYTVKVLEQVARKNWQNANTVDLQGRLMTHYIIYYSTTIYHTLQHGVSW